MLAGEVHRGLCPMGRMPHCQREQLQGVSPEEEGAAETAWNELELTTTPIPCPLYHWQEEIAELGLRKNEGGGVGEGRCI